LWQNFAIGNAPNGLLEFSEFSEFSRFSNRHKTCGQEFPKWVYYKSSSQRPATWYGCERVIHGKEHTIREIEARWTRKINNRLIIDRITASKIKRDRNHTRLTDATWKKTLKKQSIGLHPLVP
jgi:hypothetical protein